MKKARIILRSAALLLAYVALPSAASGTTCYDYQQCHDNWFIPWEDDHCYSVSGAGGPACLMLENNECADQQALCHPNN